MQAKLPHDLPPGAMNELVELIAQNRKLQACKRYKEMSGASLADSKRFIDELTVRKQQESPELFPDAKKSGCLSTIVLFVAITATAATILTRH